MKKNITYISLAAVALVLIISVQSCTKDIPQYTSFDSYTYASADETAGDWQPVYLTSTSLVALPAPSDVASADYLAEIESLKGSSSNLTSDEQDAIDYWGNNSMIRWIEIACELAAKYNLPSSPDVDGNYPAASSLSPGTYPYFPFAHPPYSARMFAYLSAASYDALLTAWHYKYLYNRPAPYKVDGSIARALPDNNLPSYPSEDAVIATVAKEVLINMFPLEADYLTQKAEELENTRLWAGMNVQSDMDAGDSIGHAVAGIFIGRAKTDSMKFASVDAATYATMENTAESMWGSQWPHWENLEVPQRPVGITPKYGHVTPWWISVADVRPGPPPAVGSAEYNDAVTELKGYADKLTDEQKEVAFYWSDGVGTYTPPGHWNTFAKQYIIDARLSPVRTARVFAYLNTSMEDAGISCWDTKYYYFYPRPPQADAGLKTLFMLPNFPSFTSGHSTFSGAASEVLSYFFPAGAADFEEYAQEASDSRKYARIHFPFDCSVGLEVGHVIGDHAIAAAAADGAN